MTREKNRLPKVVMEEKQHRSLSKDKCVHYLEQRLVTTFKNEKTA